MSSSEFKRFGEHSQANASAAQVLQQPRPARAGGLRIQNPPPTRAYTGLYAQRWCAHVHAHTHADVKKRERVAVRSIDGIKTQTALLQRCTTEILKQRKQLINFDFF